MEWQLATGYGDQATGPMYIPAIDGPEPEFYRKMFAQMELAEAEALAP
jgi:hypothetical protein